MENQCLLSREKEEEDSSVDEEQEWTDNASTYSSYYSDSDSTVPDWEPCVNDFTGDLFYIDCHPFVTQNNKEHTKLADQPEPFSKTQLRRSTRGKFLRLIRRRESKRRSRKGHVEVNVVETTNTSKVKFQDFQEGEEKTVMLEIDPENRYNLSSDKSFAESLLGLNVSTLSDGNRVMIAGFSYDSKAKNDRNIKIGDWLKSINDIEVNVNNLDDILQKFINHNEVLLKLQRVAATEVTKDPPINELNSESNFVKELLNTRVEENAVQALCKQPVGIIFINTDDLSENNQQNEDVAYCFPKPLQKNVLCNSRGLFITIHHLLHDITKSKPHKSSILLKERLVNVVYTEVDKKLLLLLLPDDKVSLREIESINKELVRFLEFSYESLDKCFGSEEHISLLDKYFLRFFTRILNDGLWTTAQQFVDSQHNKQSCEMSRCFFEGVMPLVPTLSMQDEAMMQIDDALAELEASDYREWNEEPLDCQRLFTILGSALFHSGYLLASHFIYEDLIDVYCFCRQQGILYLSETEPVKSLVMWKEVFPSSCKVTGNDNMQYPNARRYLLVVGTGKDILAVIMEAGGCTEPPEPNLGPDAFYVEEAQATLAHVQELGLSELAERNLANNGGFQIATPVPVQGRKKGDFIGSFAKPGSSPSVIIKDTQPNPKKSEVTSILKRRSSDQTFQQTTALLDDSFDNYSEGSGSQGYSEQMSEISDDSGLRQRDAKYNSNDESEGEEIGDGSQLSSYSFDISELRQSLLTETSDTQPVQLTSGFGNVLYHFVQLDASQGVIISPLDCNVVSETYRCIVDNFRKCAQSIHGVFENTLRFKNMPPQEIAKSLINKSLVAIKEYGVMFECPFLEDKENHGKNNRITYWVIGRLFHTPHPREIYICCQDAVPQNMVDLAFKIGINVAF